MRSLLAFAACSCLLLAPPLAAGDPVPDVDVTVEQVPGAGVFVEVVPAGPFDRIEVGGERGFVASLEPERLPPGWVMTRPPRGKGGFVLSGPALDVPTRFRLRGATRTVDKSVDWDVSYAGRSLAARKGVVPATVPPQVAKNSLAGIVVMPETVSPGEALTLRPLAGAQLPAGGRFVLSGVVLDPVSDEDLEDARAAVTAAVPVTSRQRPSPPRAPHTATPEPRELTLESERDLSCGDLVPLAATLFAQWDSDAPDTAGHKSFFESRSNTVRKSYFESPSHKILRSFFESRSNLLTAGHEPAKNAIRNLKAFVRVALPPATAGFTIDEKGVKRAGIAGWTVTAAAGAAREYALEGWSADAEGLPSRWIALQGRATPTGCVFTPRAPDAADLAEVVAKKAGALPGNGKDTVEARAARPRDRFVGRLPEDLLPGTAIAVQYIDRFGDVWLDVPAVPGTTVIPAPTAPEPPCLRGATVFAQAEDLVCVCGNFPTLEAQGGVWIDERPAGPAISTSTRSLQFALPPHVTALGRHVWSGDPAAGFAPSCRAETRLVQVAGEMDSQKLFSGQATPMRLTVTGSDGRVPLSIRNLTPDVIRIDGGDVQTAETGGGSPNQVTRNVSGLVRGNFNVEWSLAVDRCPCE
jgi:hypothetical protein